jgi:hypothetical protein
VCLVCQDEEKVQREAEKKAIGREARLLRDKAKQQAEGIRQYRFGRKPERLKGLAETLGLPNEAGNRSLAC